MSTSGSPPPSPPPPPPPPPEPGPPAGRSGPSKSVCPRCGYDLSGLEPVGNTYVCPECAMASRAMAWTDNYAEILRKQAERRAARRGPGAGTGPTDSAPH